MTFSFNLVLHETYEPQKNLIYANILQKLNIFSSYMQQKNNEKNKITYTYSNVKYLNDSYLYILHREVKIALYKK